MVHFSYVASLVAAFVATFVTASPAADEVFRRASTNSYCTPGQKCWPTDAQWSAFNSTVGGNLIKVTPWQNVCFSNPGPFDLAAVRRSSSHIKMATHVQTKLVLRRWTTGPTATPTPVK